MFRNSVPRFLLSFSLSILTYSCSDQPSQQELVVQTPAEIKNDEATNVVSKSLISLGRPVIRPTIVEVEKDKKAVQDGFMIYLPIKNRAELTTYQDIKYQVIYLDNLGKEIDKETIQVKKILAPGDSITVANELHHYKQTAYKVAVLSARALK